MSDLIWITKQIGSPGSIGFLGLCLAGGLMMASIGRRCRKSAGIWTILVVTAYLVAALPLVAHAIADRLPAYGPVWQPTDRRATDILVVLSGDNAFGRASAARRVLDATTPRCVLVSGSPSFARKVVEAGVSRNRFVIDDTASTTREQISKLGTWAKQCDAERVVLIASTLSMPRIAGLVRTAGVPVVLAASPLDATPVRSGVGLVLPSYRALEVARDAFYEHAALAYYRHRKWIG